MTNLIRFTLIQIMYYINVVVGMQFPVCCLWSCSLRKYWRIMRCRPRLLSKIIVYIFFQIAHGCGIYHIWTYQTLMETFGALSLSEKPSYWKYHVLDWVGDIKLSLNWKWIRSSQLGAVEYCDGIVLIS